MYNTVLWGSRLYCFFLLPNKAVGPSLNQPWQTENILRICCVLGRNVGDFHSTWRTIPEVLNLQNSKLVLRPSVFWTVSPLQYVPPCAKVNYNPLFFWVSARTRAAWNTTKIVHECAREKWIDGCLRILCYAHVWHTSDCCRYAVHPHCFALCNKLCSQ